MIIIVPLVIDIDECTQDRYICTSPLICVNHAGSYMCVHDPAYTITVATPGDERREITHDVTQTEATPTCDVGFEFSDRTRRCEGRIEL